MFCCCIRLSELQRVFLCLTHTWLFNKMLWFDRLHALMFHFASCSPQPCVTVGLDQTDYWFWSKRIFSSAETVCPTYRDTTAAQPAVSSWCCFKIPPPTPNTLSPASSSSSISSPLLSFHFISRCSAYDSPLRPSPCSPSWNLCCVRHLHSWKAWREQVLIDTERIHAAHRLTAQVLRESQGCLPVSPSVPFWTFLPGLFLVFLPRVSKLTSILRAETGPWIWAVSAVSNLIMMWRFLSFSFLADLHLLSYTYRREGARAVCVCLGVLVCVRQRCCRSVLSSCASVRVGAIFGSAVTPLLLFDAVLSVPSEGQVM